MKVLASACFTQALFCAAVAPAAAQGAREWTPDAAMVARVEAFMQTHMPSREGSATLRKPLRLEDFARYYAGVFDSRGRKMVRGVFVGFDAEHYPRGSHIVPENDLPMILDGGCGIIEVQFDVEAGRAPWAACNGLA